MSTTSFSFKFNSLRDASNFRAKLLDYYESSKKEAPIIDISRLPHNELTVEGFPDYERTNELLTLLSRIDV